MNRTPTEPFGTNPAGEWRSRLARLEKAGRRLIPTAASAAPA